MSHTDKDRPWQIREKDPLDPLHGFSWRDWYLFSCDVPAWYINHAWNAPERRKVMEYGKSVVKDYRANGEVESEYQSNNHRHGAAWHWW